MHPAVPIRTVGLKQSMEHGRRMMEHSAEVLQALQAQKIFCTWHE
jgi:hypothetical protein